MNLTIVGKSERSISIYLNGVEVGSVPTKMWFGYLPPNDFTYMHLHEKCESYARHSYRFSVGKFNGALDDLTIYTRALSAKEVRTLCDEETSVFDVYHTVRQGVQQPTVTPNLMKVPQVGVTTNIKLTVARAVNWEAVPSESWISIVGAASGTGSSDILVKVNPNTTCYPRTGTVAIGPTILTIEQEGLGCTLVTEKTIFPCEADETGGMGIIEVSPENGGSWQAECDVDWISCWPEDGAGSADVYFFVEDVEDIGASRTGTITMGGQTVRITQRGYDLSIDPAVAEVGGNAGAGIIGVAADPDAIWTAVAAEPWITIVANSGEGVGSGTVRFTFTDNTTGETRTGHIRIAGEEYVLTQTCTLELKTAVVGEGAVTGGGNYAQGKTATLTAIPSSGYSFSHWSGDMVGVETTGTLKMDSVKNVTATFIPEAAAQKLAEQKAAQGGFYTRDQIHNLEVGNLVLDVDSTTGKARIGVQLQETSDLSNPNWQPVNVTAGDLDIGNDGTVGIQATATGNAKFFRVVTPSK